MKHDASLSIKRFVFNPFMENTYLIWDKLSLSAMIIDPGNSIPEEDASLKNFISDHNLDLQYLVNTHGHIDHILGNGFVLRNFSVKHYIPRKDMFLFDNAKAQSKMFGIEFNNYELNPLFLDDIQSISLGNIKVELIYTPGHTPGEFCLHIPEENVLFAGDVLFYESIGRTDLAGGNSEELLLSIREKLFVLNPETTVFPGHGDETSIDNEIKNNPFFY